LLVGIAFHSRIAQSPQEQEPPWSSVQKAELPPDAASSVVNIVLPSVGSSVMLFTSPWRPCSSRRESRLRLLVTGRKNAIWSNRNPLVHCPELLSFFSGAVGPPQEGDLANRERDFASNYCRFVSARRFSGAAGRLPLEGALCGIYPL
jgi:hypothetical protein